MQNDKLDDYVHRHTSPEALILAELNRQTHVRELQPRMLSGHLQGRLLSMLSHMIRPMRVLEIGTYTGYSAIALAQGLQAGGKLVTIDKNDEIEHIAIEYFAKAKLADCIEMQIGDAKEIIPTLDEDWDLVFIDADKPSYPQYYELLIDKLHSGAYILADNVLWDGKVCDHSSTHDAYTAGIVEFNRMVQADARVENVLIPMRDGLMLIRKL